MTMTTIPISWKIPTPQLVSGSQVVIKTIYSSFRAFSIPIGTARGNSVGVQTIDP